MTGSLAIVGLGPGPACWISPEASAVLEAASDVVGYSGYLDRVAKRAGQRHHGSGNRVELARARLALTLAAEGRMVAVVSGGDPGIFAMAAAVFEAIENGDPSWRALDITVAPGISALQAAAARLGAPLGHDFCAVSLSDNLKPWGVVERRLRAAADADFVIALFNPASAARPERIHQAFALLRACRPEGTPVGFARAIGRPDERIIVTTLGAADPSIADMSTLVLIGSSETRFIERRDGQPWLLTPRAHGLPSRHSPVRAGDPFPRDEGAAVPTGPDRRRDVAAHTDQPSDPIPALTR
jgi:precorrin-3B C17-methyltransferase